MSKTYYLDVIEILRANGFARIDGGKGSHEKWRNAVIGKSITVPRNLVNRHTANEVLKQAGLKKAF